MTIYFQERDGLMLNHTEYVEGSFYREYFIENDFLSVKKIYNKRHRSVPEEEEYRLQLVNSIDFNAQNVVMHNHVAPINEAIYTKLVSIADRNIYTYRKDKRAQLASYAIAYSTKQFVLFKPEYKVKSMVKDIDSIHLENLIKRIEIYDGLTKKEEIAYEDMEFIQSESNPENQNALHMVFRPNLNYPVKQVDDYKKLLSNNMLQIIDNLVTNYECRRAAN